LEITSTAVIVVASTDEGAQKRMRANPNPRVLNLALVVVICAFNSEEVSSVGSVERNREKGDCHFSQSCTVFSKEACGRNGGGHLDRIRDASVAATQPFGRTTSGGAIISS
jgi:hypothetical protein